ELWPEPMRSALMNRRRINKGARCGLDGLHLFVQLAQFAVIEARADFARELQFSVRIVAQQQRPEVAALATRFGIAADDELLLVTALELEPGSAALPGLIRRLRILGDQSLP